jgi:hypothetical protein
MSDPFHGIEPIGKRPEVTRLPQIGSTVSPLNRLVFWLVILLAILNAQLFYFVATNIYDRAELASQKAKLEKLEKDLRESEKQRQQAEKERRQLEEQFKVHQRNQGDKPIDK